ncbi:MAG: pantoate--beta-alanine ligase [Candidatus Limnocylindria bacterium]
MKLVRTIAELRAALEPEREQGARIGLVPTMGALHDGHLSLIAAAREASDLVVLSLFVNPAQFGRGEDLEHYPRDEAHDVAAAEGAGVDLLFAPDAAEMYPEGFDTWVDPGKVGSYLEGAARPGHFRGVATICTRLFLLVEPQRAFFGRKDAQQVAVVKQVVRDLALPVEIVACPTVRDTNGLALSSRNVFLSPEERAVAVALPRALRAGLAAHRSGDDAVRAARAVLDAEPGLRVDYVAEADLDGPTLAAAVVVGSTRLIDNVRLSAEA